MQQTLGMQSQGQAAQRWAEARQHRGQSLPDIYWQCGLPALSMFTVAFDLFTITVSRMPGVIYNILTKAWWISNCFWMRFGMDVYELPCICLVLAMALLPLPCRGKVEAGWGSSKTCLEVYVTGSKWVQTITTWKTTRSFSSYQNGFSYFAHCLYFEMKNQYSSQRDNKTSNAKLELLWSYSQVASGLRNDAVVVIVSHDLTSIMSSTQTWMLAMTFRFDTTNEFICLSCWLWRDLRMKCIHFKSYGLASKYGLLIIMPKLIRTVSAYEEWLRNYLRLWNACLVKCCRFKMKFDKNCLTRYVICESHLTTTRQGQASHATVRYLAIRLDSKLALITIMQARSYSAMLRVNSLSHMNMPISTPVKV